MNAIFTSSIAALLSLSVYAIYAIWIRPALSPVRSLPGPSGNPDFFFGHFHDIHFADIIPIYKSWTKKYGDVVSLKGPFNSNMILVSDLRAIKEITTRCMDFEKSKIARKVLQAIVGDGLVVTEGEQHKRQRKLVNISFYPATIKALAPIFFTQAQQLREYMDGMIPRMEKTKDSAKNSKQEAEVIDVYKWCGAAVLNMIGLGGFGYQFNALPVEGVEPSELYNVMHSLYHGAAVGKSNPMMFARFVIPELRYLPTKKNRRVKEGMATWRRVSKQLFEERRRAMFEGKIRDKQELDGVAQADQDYIHGRDLLSVMVKANADPNISDDQRLPDADVTAQIITFLVAGHETTAASTTWCLFALAQFPDIQVNLREELLSVTTDMPSIDDLNALPYLDMVIRESMRLHPAIPYTLRVAKKDDVLPLSKGYTDKTGKFCNELRVCKGDTFLLPLEHINRSEEIWGKDAAEFNPERFSQNFDTGIPGVWAGMMTFLGGPRSCIGYRFALYEMKILIFTLVRSFTFDLACPVEDVAKYRYISSRPFLHSQEGKGVQMPLKVSRYRDARSALEE